MKNGRQKARKVHPVVDEVLEETHGVMVYQEQVMRILNRVGDVPLAGAYQCIKAISKKKEKIIAGYYDGYLEGAEKNGIDKELAQELWDMIIAFAGYGFNKSHSTAYALIAYETAYLKAHYPVEFMAALLSCGMESTERISEHVDDARRMKLEVLAPDINSSEVEFGFVDGKVTFGMGAIKGVGAVALQAIVDERNANGVFKNIYDLTERVDPKLLTKGSLGDPHQRPARWTVSVRIGPNTCWSSNARSRQRLPCRRTKHADRRACSVATTIRLTKRSAAKTSASRTLRTGHAARSWPSKKKCWASTSPPTRWPNTATGSLGTPAIGMPSSQSLTTVLKSQSAA